MRRLLSAAGVAVLSVAIVLSGVPASAVEPPKPPVSPFAELPSKLLSSFQALFTHADSTGSPAIIGDYNPATHGDLSKYPVGSIGWQEEAAKAEAYLASKGYANPNTKLPSAVNMAKTSASMGARSPLTLPGVLSRAGGGAVGVAGIVGFGLGTGGLALYAATTGNDPWAAMCGGSPPEQVLADIQRNINFGIGPDCTAPVLDPNAEKPSMHILEAAGFPTVTKGLYLANYFGQSGECVIKTPGNGAIPANYILEKSGATGWTSPSQPGANATNFDCGITYPAQASHIWQPAGYSLRWRNLTTGHIILGEDVSPNPTRTTNCTIDFKDGTATSSAGPSYDDEGGLPLGGIGTACNGAWFAKNGGSSALVGAGRIRVTSTDTSSGGATTTLLDQPVAPSTAEQQAMADRTSTAPNPGRGLILSLSVAGVTDNCLTWAANCAGWWAETENGTVATHGNRTYTCSFDGATVALGECVVYKTTFDTPTATPVVTDPVTDTETDWQTGPVGVNPGNTGNPGTMPNGSSDPHSDCMAEWPGAPDPISWVLHPVKCALVWAFVPRESEVARLTGELTEMWETTGVGLTINTVSAWQFVPPPEDGCSGVLVPASTIFGHGVEDFTILDACPGSPLEATAGWCWLIVLVGALINLAKSMTRNIGSIVGAKGVADGESA